MLNLRSSSVFALLALLALAVPRAEAVPIYTCPGGSTECAGQTFALYVTNSGTGFFDIAFSINTLGYTGSEADLAYGVEFKNITDQNNQYSSISLLSAPGDASDWGSFTDQLSQNCTANDANPGDIGCGVWSGTGAGYDFAIGDVLTWIFHVTTNDSIGNGTGHIKYEYRDEDGKMVAGLLSQDIALQEGVGTLVPEPGSLILLGTALALLGAHGVRRGRRYAS